MQFTVVVGSRSRTIEADEFEIEGDYALFYKRDPDDALSKTLVASTRKPIRVVREDANVQ